MMARHPAKLAWIATAFRPLEVVDAPDRPGREQVFIAGLPDVRKSPT